MDTVFSIQCATSHNPLSFLHSSRVVSLCLAPPPKITSSTTPKLRTKATAVPVVVVLSASLSSSMVPARDRIIDFGKHKGKMLGTLPSNYLKWVSKNLRARDYEEWATRADEVLKDPVYRDRIEWEFAEKVLNGDVSGSLSRSANQSAVSELLEMSERFGWDNEDKVGWSKIDFGLLGTSKGAPIPRLLITSNNNIGFGGDVDDDAEREIMKREKVGPTPRGSDGGGERRRERRERLGLKKKKSSSSSPMEERNEMIMRSGSRQGMMKITGFEDDDDEVDEIRNQEDPTAMSSSSSSSSPFPGRQSLLKKVLNTNTNTNKNRCSNKRLY